ncbi:MAG: glycosyltransferase family 1 protein [Anaerolineae bacterium]|nr:glycosyltransferase family 1 protein [Anaerolineae bacterium]
MIIVLLNDCVVFNDSRHPRFDNGLILAIGYDQIDKEIVCFESLDDLVEKIRYNLTHDKEPAAIVEAGYHRTFRDHICVHRFIESFHRIGFSTNPRIGIVSRLGQVTEIK